MRNENKRRVEGVTSDSRLAHCLSLSPFLFFVQGTHVTKPVSDPSILKQRHQHSYIQFSPLLWKLILRQ
jgi:hypothetical protein